MAFRNPFFNGQGGAGVSGAAGAPGAPGAPGDGDVSSVNGVEPIDGDVPLTYADLLELPIPVSDDELTGDLDGENLIFETAFTPLDGTFQLFLNGQLQRLGENYTRTGSTITFTVAPVESDWLCSFYTRAA